MEDDEVFIESGDQGGHHITFNARMSGLEPGTDAEANDRPLTRFSLTNDDGERIDFGGCAFRSPYQPSGSGDPSSFVMDYGRIVILDSNTVEQLDGTRATIKLEIVDPLGIYATDELSVVLRYVPEAPTVSGELPTAGDFVGGEQRVPLAE